MKAAEELVISKIGRKFWIYRDDSFYRQRVANVGPYQKHNLVRLRELVPNANVILDVGMNIGMNTIEYATWAKEVHGFEPTKQTCAMAVRNIRLAKKQKADELTGWYQKPDGSYASCAMTGRVMVHCYGIGDKEGKAELALKTNNAGQNFIVDGSQRRSSPQQSEKVNVATIDSHNFSNVDAIKIDVEGYEYKVLLGAEKTIRKWKPVIQLEILENHASRFGVTPQQIYDWFLSRGYTITLSDGTDAGTTWQKVRNKMDRFFIPKGKRPRARNK